MFSSGCLGRERSLLQATQTSVERHRKVVMYILEIWQMQHFHCIPFNACLCVRARRANSVAWNPHKLLLAGLQCSALLLRDCTVCSRVLRLLRHSVYFEGYWKCSDIIGTRQSFISQGLLKRCHVANATYLFQQDKFYDLDLDIGDKSLQCSRKVDCLKLWLMWKAVGSSGLEERVNKAFFNVR